MLSGIPDTLYGRAGALVSALIVICCVIGLTMHRDFYAGRRRKDFFCFYTNLSNLLVLAYFALIAPRLYAASAGQPLIPHAEFAVMMCIMLTFSVFHVLLYPAIRMAAENMPHTRDYRIVYADNLIVHYLVPWLVFVYWLLCSPGKQTLGLKDAFVWTLIPLVYVLMMFLRAAGGRIIEDTQSPYPYPFMDVRALGMRKVAVFCAGLYGAALLAGAGVIALVRIAFTIFGTHALILI